MSVRRQGWFLDATSSGPNGDSEILKRGRRAGITLVIVNSAALATFGALTLTPYAEIGGDVLFWLVGVQVLFGLVWFLPVFLYQVAVRRRGVCRKGIVVFRRSSRIRVVLRHLSIRYSAA